MTERHDLPVKPVSGRTRFIAKVQSAILGRQLRHQLAGRLRRVGDLAKVANLTRPVADRDRHRILLLRRIERDERFPISRHGSSPMR